MTVRCFQGHPDDDVATLLDDLPAPATLRVLNCPTISCVEAIGPVRLGHKIALTDIGAGRPIVKHSVPIGTATRPIARGEWVHLHNCASNYDVRSQSFDVHTGATTDTRYE